MLDPGLVVKDGIAGGAEDVGTGGAAGAGAGTETGGAEVVGETPGLIDGAVAAAAAIHSILSIPYTHYIKASQIY